MANPIHCDPRTLLKQLAIPLVQRLFEQRGELLDLPWSELRQKKQTAPIYAAWQRLPEDRRREIQIVFHEIAEAATELGIAAVALGVDGRRRVAAIELPTKCAVRYIRSLDFMEM